MKDWREQPAADKYFKLLAMKTKPKIEVKTIKK